MTAGKRPRLWTLALAMTLSAGAATPAPATTLFRADLETLVSSNETIVLGEVLEAHSYWNDDGTFILTDVVVAPEDVIKGAPDEQQVTVTVMGGSVGELSTLIVGGARLIPGERYLLFLDRQDLPGAPSALTVPDHVQGVFDVKPGKGGPRAVSQAAFEPLVPDRSGASSPPGGIDGLPLNELVASVRDLAHRPASRPAGEEVQ